MGQTIKLILLGDPMAKQSTRVAANGYKLVHKRGKLVKVPKIRAYTKKKYKERLSDYQAQIKKQLPPNFKLFKGAVFIDRLLVVLQPTKQMLGSKERKKQFEQGRGILHTKRPDLPDNLKKLLLDSLSGIVYEDDGLICMEQNTKKVYALNPRIEITLTGEIDPTKGFTFVDLD